MKKNIIAASFILLISSFVFLPVCALAEQPGIEQQKKIEAKAKKTLMRMKDVYEDKNLLKFMSCISRDYYRNYEDFEDTLRDDFNKYDVVEIVLIVDSVLSDDDKVEIKTHWNKAYINRTNNQRLTKKGVTVFTFASRDDSLRLIDMEGDILFGEP